MKILLATGIFYPDVGGPAIHVRKIAEKLSSLGFDVTVLTYGDGYSRQFSFRVKYISRRLPKIVQWLLYFLWALRFSFRANLVYAFDPTSAGVPACLTSRIFQKPFLIRIGGDPIWEREAEKGNIFITLDEYYKKSLYKKDKPILFHIIRTVLKRAKVVVVYGQKFKDFYFTYYNIPLNKIRIVKNPVFRREVASPTIPQAPTILFAGRFVSYKNIPLVLRAFNEVHKKISNTKLLLIGKGPDKDTLMELASKLSSKDSISFRDSVDQDALFGSIKDSAICIGPALSEFNPNFILEALSFGKPILLSQGHSLSVELPDKFIFNPFNQEELELKMKDLLDPIKYSQAVLEVEKLPLNQSWEDVLNFHSMLVKEFIIQ